MTMRSLALNLTSMGGLPVGPLARVPLTSSHYPSFFTFLLQPYPSISFPKRQPCGKLGAGPH